MPRFSDFDSRGYRTVDARTGYAGWVSSYEDTVEDAMDLELLERLGVDWAAAGEAADLGCGTGRIGAWLRARGVAAVDGVDLTPEMLARADARGAYRRLAEADVGATGLETGGVRPGHLLPGGRAPRVTLAPVRRGGAPGARRAGPSSLRATTRSSSMATGIPTHYDDPSGSRWRSTPTCT